MNAYSYQIFIIWTNNCASFCPHDQQRALVTCPPHVLRCHRTNETVLWTTWHYEYRGENPSWWFISDSCISSFLNCVCIKRHLSWLHMQTSVPDTGHAWSHLDGEFMQTRKYLWEEHTFSLLSCVKICVRGEILFSKKNEKMNIQFNFILGGLFSQSTVIKHTWKKIVKLYTGWTSWKFELSTTSLCVICKI